MARAISGPTILNRYIFGNGGINLNSKFLSLIRKGTRMIRLIRNRRKISIETGTSGPRIFTNKLINAKKNADKNPNNIPVFRL